MTELYTPSDEAVSAGEKILAGALSEPVDGFWRGIVTEILEAAHEADTEPFEAVGEAMGVLSAPINPARRR